MYKGTRWDSSVVQGEKLESGKDEYGANRRTGDWTPTTKCLQDRTGKQAGGAKAATKKENQEP